MYNTTQCVVHTYTKTFYNKHRTEVFLSYNVSKSRFIILNVGIS